jgi:hypothetical protein
LKYSLPKKYYCFSKSHPKSAKRLQKLKEFQTLSGVNQRKILKHVSTRWLSLGTCINRLLPVVLDLTTGVNVFVLDWDSFVVAVAELLDLGNALVLEVGVLGFTIQEALHSQSFRLYCEFLDYIIPVFNGFNVSLQREQPYIHKLRSTLLDLIREIMLYPFLKDASFCHCFCFVHTIAQFSRILRFSHIYCQIFCIRTHG